MPVPIVCLDPRIRQWAATFATCFSKPQYQHFVTVLLGLLLCQEGRTLTGLRRQVAGGPSVASLSRFLARAPWDASAVAQVWRARFDSQVAPAVQAERERQRQARPQRVGRPREPLVTGYLIGDDSTLAKPKGTKMEGVGRQYSSTVNAQVRGHSLVQGLYVLLGRRCPLTPRLYQQKSACAAQDIPFRSKIDLMEEQIRTFAPVEGTHTHVLLDSWYGAKSLWKAARARDFLITTGLKSNRALRVPAPDVPQGWRWQQMADYAAGLTATDFTLLVWPRQGAADAPRQVYVHVVDTRVRSLYRCQIVVARPALDAPPTATRYWASSDLSASVADLLTHIAMRWEIEVFFSDTKDLLGLDQYQVLTTTAIVRFWTLVLAAYALIEEERARLAREQGCHVTSGEARRMLQRLHYRHLLGWIEHELHAGSDTDALYDHLVA